MKLVSREQGWIFHKENKTNVHVVQVDNIEDFSDTGKHDTHGKVIALHRVYMQY